MLLQDKNRTVVNKMQVLRLYLNRIKTAFYFPHKTETNVDLIESCLYPANRYLNSECPNLGIFTLTAP